MAGGKMRLNIHTAIASIITPNTALVAYSQAPALGNNLPAEAPNSNKGTPMPKPIANKALPPNTALPVWPI